MLFLRHRPVHILSPVGAVNPTSIYSDFVCLVSAVVAAVAVFGSSFVRPFLMASTLSTITASIPSLT